MKLKKDDIVIVTAGKDKGKKGRVLKVLREEGRVIVEGVNFVKKHTRKSQNNPQGGIISFEAPVDVSNVLLFCNTEKKGSRVGFKCLEDGTKIRVFKTTGEAVGKA